MMLTRSPLTQRSTTSPCAAKAVEDLIAAVGLELVQDAEQLADAPLRPAFFFKPAKVFEREIEQRHAVRWIMIRAVFSERHEGASDVGEIGGKPVAEVFIEGIHRVQDRWRMADDE